ncbi:hypothetical protein TeGR_g6720 [Tetraparma gracilis]|uniref:Uncharacterized protein n=1 Tax=Tetraparma gracilis TaxID=2962635 RepID=A0ABQ6MR33_9STRA|nr:hypothetical protein TeGR_g6720 [Tetraparma gracilis]
MHAPILLPLLLLLAPASASFESAKASLPAVLEADSDFVSELGDIRKDLAAAVDAARELGAEDRLKQDRIKMGVRKANSDIYEALDAKCCM